MNYPFKDPITPRMITIRIAILASTSTLFIMHCRFKCSSSSKQDGFWLVVNVLIILSAEKNVHFESYYNNVLPLCFYVIVVVVFFVWTKVWIRWQKSLFIILVWLDFWSLICPSCSSDQLENQWRHPLKKLYDLDIIHVCRMEIWALAI